MGVARAELARVRELVSLEGAIASDPPSTGGWLQRMCRAAARDLPATGVGVSLVNDHGALLTAASSGAASALVEELQFTLGEGPCVEAYTSRLPVLVPDLDLDLDGTVGASWPGYVMAAREHGVRSIFAFPLQVGTVSLGALDVYREHTGDLSPQAMSRALAFAEIATDSFLDPTSAGVEMVEEPGDPQELRYTIYQAQGMVMVQLGISLDDALARLRAHAFVSGRSLAEVADEVLNRRMFMERDLS